MRRHHISITYNFGTIHDIYLFKYFYIQKNIVKGGVLVEFQGGIFVNEF